MRLNSYTRNYNIILVDESAIDTFKVNIKQLLLEDIKLNSDLNISKLNNTFLITNLDNIYYFCYFQTNIDWFVTNYLMDISNNSSGKIRNTCLYTSANIGKIKYENLVECIIKVENDMQPKIKVLDWINQN
jgi:hypothetical protein